MSQEVLAIILQYSVGGQEQRVCLHAAAIVLSFDPDQAPLVLILLISHFLFISGKFRRKRPRPSKPESSVRGVTNSKFRYAFASNWA